MRKIKRFVQLINDPSIDSELMRAVTLLFHAYDTSFSMRSGVHYLLFKTALEGGGTEEQIKKYADDVQLRLTLNFNLVGILIFPLQEDENNGMFWDDRVRGWIFHSAV